jgi:hypothetical protein
VNEPDPVDPRPEPGHSRADRIWLVARIAVFLVLPMLLLAAMMPAQQCGGG